MDLNDHDKADKVPAVDVRPLWNEANELFYSELGETKRQRITDQTTLEATVKDLKNAKDKVSNEYSTHTFQLGRKTIDIKLGRVLQRLELLLQVGDTAVKFGPESVSLVWSAFRMIFTGFLVDAETCVFLADAVDQISDILFVCEVYARRYLVKTTEYDGASALGNEVLIQIPPLYAVILKFSYHMRTLVNHGKFGRTMTGLFGVKGKELTEIINKAKEKRDKLQRTADIAFKDAALSVLQDLLKDSRVLNDLLESDIAPAIKTIQVEQVKSREQSEEKALEESYKEQLRWIESGTIARRELPGRQYHANLQKRHLGTCKWLFEVEEYQKWRDQENPSCLWLSGDSGVGKSFLVSSIIEALQNYDPQQLNRKSRVLYFFCKVGDDTTQLGIKVVLHLLSQLFGFARMDDKDNSKTLAEDRIKKEKCINVVGEARKKLKDTAKDDSFQVQMKSVLQPIFENIAKILEARFFIVIDALDECSDWENGFVDFLKATVEAGTDIRVLISSRPKDNITQALADVPNIEVTGSRTSADIRAYVSESLKTLKDIKRLSPQQRVKASAKIADQSGGMFRYASMAVESLRQPRAKMTPFDKLMNELPNGMNNLYRQTLQALQTDERQMLLTALRWLLCGEGEIEAMLVADELEHMYEDEEEDTYEEEEYTEDIESRDFASTNGPSVTSLLSLGATATPVETSGSVIDTASQHDETSRATIDELKRIGREFLKFDSNIIGLQHNSVRDFIVADEKQMHGQSSRCPECVERFNQTSTHQASPKYGHLLMVKNMFHKLNSPSFQKKFILIEGLIEKEARIESEHGDINTQGLDAIVENQDQSAKTGEQKEIAHGEETKPGNESETTKPTNEDENAQSNIELDNATDADPEDQIPGDFDELPEPPLRYELTHWPEHLRAAEQAWPEEERDPTQWDDIYSAVETFMSPDSLVFKCWQRKVLHWLKSYDDPLHVAARYGLVGLMHKYLNQGTGVDLLNENGCSALHLVCDGKGKYTGLEMLVEHGADINLQASMDQATPLLLMVEEGNVPLEKVQYLLKNGAKPEVPDEYMITCLHKAAYYDNLELCKVLLSYDRVDVNARDHAGETPLHWVFKWPNAQPELVNLLLNKGAHVNAQDNDSQAPLYEACLVGNLEGARLLLDHGADVNDGEKVFGWTALHAAIKKGDLGTVKLLVERKADLSLRDKQGRDPVSQAASEGDNNILSLLLNAWKAQGSNMQFLLTPDIKGHTPLHRSAAKGNEEAVRMLISTGKALEICSQVNHNGAIPLHSAARRGHAKVVKILVESGSDVRARTDGGKTPLDLAFLGWKAEDYGSTAAFVETIELLANKVPALAQQPDLFYFAIEKDAVQICRLLVELTNEEDSHGWTPLVLAIQLQQHDIIRLLSPYDTKQLLDAFSTRREIALGLPPMRWSLTDKHPRLTLSADCMELSCLSTTDDPRMIARAEHPVPAGVIRFYYEITIIEAAVDTPILGFGFCSQYAAIDKMPGWWSALAPSWGYHGDDGNKFEHVNISGVGILYGETYGPGDVVGCGVDFTTETIYYTKNGTRLPTAFENVRGRLFPVVGMGYHAVKIRANFGHEENNPFKYSGWKD